MEKDAGTLRDLVSLFANTPTDTGDHLGTSLRTQWCRIEPAGGRAVEIGQVTGSLESHKITFRHLPTVEQGWWVQDQQGQQYEIMRVATFRRDRQEAWARLNHPAGIVSP
jgi:hypothetical protein